MATSEGIPSSIDIEFLELNDNPYISKTLDDLGKINYLLAFIIVITHKYE